MGTISQQHLPVRGQKRFICLTLAKRPEGVTSLEALRGGGGSRLAAHIWALKRRGHKFRTEDERDGDEVFTRYWWEGWEETSPLSSILPPPLPPSQPGIYSANL